MTYFPEQGVIHLAMNDEDEMASMELSSIKIKRGEQLKNMVMDRELKGLKQ